MEKEERRRRTYWLIFGLIIGLIILWRILTPLLKVAHPDL
jgi:predicted nucleic acid-binding Zn ribbon protein